MKKNKTPDTGTALKIISKHRQQMSKEEAAVLRNLVCVADKQEKLIQYYESALIKMLPWWMRARKKRNKREAEKHRVQLANEKLREFL